jgi:hypothetical protein
MYADGWAIAHPTQGHTPEILNSLDLALTCTRDNFVLSHVRTVLLLSSSSAIAVSRSGLESSLFQTPRTIATAR